jgi:hypothetical protein
MRIAPADRLAELAVADDVDAGTRLLAYDAANRVAKTFLIGFYVIRLAALLGAQEFLQSLRTDQAADMRGENAIGAAFHARVAKRPDDERQRVGGGPGHIGHSGARAIARRRRA